MQNWGDSLFLQSLALLRHPAIAQAAVLPIPHVIMGNVGRAYVVPREGFSPSVAEIRKFLGVIVARYKIPLDFKFVDSLPLTSVGKPKKSQLAAEIATEFASRAS